MNSTGRDQARARGGASAAAPRRRRPSRRRAGRPAGSAARTGRWRARAAGRCAARGARATPSCIARLEQPVAALAVALGDVHRGVGVADQLVGVDDASPGSTTEMPMLPRSVELACGRRAAARRAARGSARRRRRPPGARRRPRAGRANSSPPKRAAVSLAADARRPGACATSTSTSSPAAWPRLSLIVLKSSRSRKIDGRRRAARGARGRSRGARARRTARGWPGPVTGSWNAWWASCSSNALRSLTSRALSTMPPTCSSSSRLVSRISNWRDAAVAVAQRALERPRLRARRPRPSASSCSSRVAVAGGDAGGRSGVPTSSSGVVAEDALDRRALVDDGGVGVEHGDEVAGVAHERRRSAPRRGGGAPPR